MKLQTVQVRASELPTRLVWLSGGNWTHPWGYPYDKDEPITMGEEDFATAYTQALADYDCAVARLEAMRIIRRKFSEVTNG